jgi:hypothetical protein
MRALRALACVLACGVLVGACLDLSPAPYEAPEGGLSDASLSDVVFEVGGPDAPGAACTQCLTTHCSAAKSACEQNAKCAMFELCMSATQCWGASLLNLTNLPPCLIQCGTSANLIGQTDPASALASPLLNCAQDPSTCASACVGTADQ